MTTEGYVVVIAARWEYFCNACGTLRLYAKDNGRPTACGRCRSPNIQIGELGAPELTKLREERRGTP